MKIERVEVFGIAMPMVGGCKSAYLTKSAQKSPVVRITAGGISGLGNVDPTPGYSKEQTPDHLEVLRNRFAPLITGMDATNVHAVLAKFESAVKGFLDSKAAIEMACVDLAARIAGMPLHAYLGGVVKERLLFNVTRKIDLTSGSLALPGGPGLGVTLDNAKLKKYRLEVKAAA